MKVRLYTHLWQVFTSRCPVAWGWGWGGEVIVAEFQILLLLSSLGTYLPDQPWEPQSTFSFESCLLPMCTYTILNPSISITRSVSTLTRQWTTSESLIHFYELWWHDTNNQKCVFRNVKIDAQRRRKYVNQNKLCPVNCRVANYKACWIEVTNAILVSHGQTLKVEGFCENHSSYHI